MTPTTSCKQAVTYFSPTAQSSPLYGKERLARDVQLDVEFLTAAGYQAAPLLRGRTRGLAVRVADRSARLSGLDYRTRLRTPVALPALAADVPSYDGALPDVKPGLESTWVASYVLAACGFPVAPSPRTGARLYQPMHGSAAPFLAKPFLGSPPSRIYDTGTGATLGPVEFGSGPFALGTVRQVSARKVTSVVSLADDPSLPAFIGNDTHCSGRIELWVQVDGTEWAASSIVMANAFYSATLTYAPTLQLQLVGPGGSKTMTGPAVPADGAWHRIGAHWDDAAGGATFAVDAQVVFVGGTPMGIASPTSDADWVATLQTVAPVAEIHITAGLAVADPFLDTAFTAAAVLDRSANRLDGIVPGTPAEAWQILQDLAAAEQGAVYLTADGTPNMATRARLLTTAAQVSQRDVDAASDLFDLAYEQLTVDKVANIITAPYQPVTVTAQAKAWTPSQTVVIPGASSVTLQAGYTGLATSQRSITGHANTAADGTGTSYTLGSTGPVTVSVTYLSDIAAAVTVTNSLGVPVWLVDSSGQTDLTLTGDLIGQGSGANPPVITSQTSRDTYGDQPLTLPANMWVQRREFAAGLAMVTAGDLAVPQPVFTDLPIPGDPRLEPFDRITARDPDNTGVALDLWYVGGTHAVEASGHYETQVIARPARNRYLAGTGLPGVDLVG